MATKRNIALPALLIIMGCAVFAFAAWSAINSPVMASILNQQPQAPQPPRLQPFAQVNIAKPAAAAGEVNTAIPAAEIPTVTATLPAQVEISATEEVQIIPTVETFPTAEISIVEEIPTATPDVSNTGVVSAAIVPDTPTPEVSAETTYAPVTGSGEHWIDVDLSQQRVYAYEGDTVVNSFLVSTGTWQTPTVTGRFKIWVKLRSASMSGPGYYLPNVPYVMYFYGSYGLHGTYWHNNFGTPMSHGCVNLSTPDAEWLYNFSSVGTVVNVHD